MSANDLAIIPVIILGLTTVALLVSQNWRWSIALVAVQYLAVFWLVSLVWPLGLAVVKLVAGWMAGAVLGASRQEDDPVSEGVPTQVGALFRMIAAALILALIVSVLPVIAQRLPVPQRVLEGGLIMIGIGLLHLGMSTRPLRVILGLLTALSGFELIYAGLETSIFMAGLQAAITLGLALVGAYLLAAKGMESHS